MSSKGPLPNMEVLPNMGPHTTWPVWSSCPTCNFCSPEDLLNRGSFWNWGFSPQRRSSNINKNKSMDNTLKSVLIIQYDQNISTYTALMWNSGFWRFSILILNHFLSSSHSSTGLYRVYTLPCIMARCSCYFVSLTPRRERRKREI